MTTRLKDIFQKEENLPEPEKSVVHSEPLSWNGKIDITEIKKFRFSFRPFSSYYFIDKSGDLFYTKQLTQIELDELDRGEADELNLKMKTVRNLSSLSPAIYYDDLGDSHTLSPGQSKQIRVSRQKTRIVEDSEHCFKDSTGKQYVEVSRFSGETIDDENTETPKE